MPSARTLALLAALAAAPAAAEVTWRESHYNPAPAAGDHVLPMPCGGAMVFRRVETGSPDGAIGDVDRTVGVEGDAQPYLNGLRKAYVSGAFSDGTGQPGRTFFYLGKYEIAAAQYAAVMEPECPGTPRRRNFLPAVEHSRLEFQDFAERYTLWLLKEVPGALPMVGDASGFVRLPTEAEWEYAARGGEAVEPVAFRGSLPPMADGEAPSEFIAHGGTESAGGKVQAIGTLKPNPLGLHDMIGNVAELTETDFALVRHGRLHGRTGGLVKRGGDARTPLASLNSATRFEVPPFDTVSVAPTRDRYTGARVAITGLSITSSEQAGELAAGLARLAEVDSALPSATSEEDVLTLIAAMQADAATPGLRAQLDLISATLVQSRAERNTLRDKALRLLLESGAWMCDHAVVRVRNVILLEGEIPRIEELRAAAIVEADAEAVRQVDALEADLRAKIDETNSNVDGLATLYANLIEGLAGDYSPELLTRQGDFVRAGLAQHGRQPACLTLLDEHVAARAAAGASDLPAIVAAFRSLAAREVEEEGR